ncbi:hypothetical protein RF11_08747 [Thelohanellus kitauei]|uniref:Uncharacterized protein n=1 Tax=Thelohanellus kitauei TaxID=669202 RepID=A0A0C2MFY6_THEKT|nr:hypothetical protein RF11_08747 [Thelohanellus kitauei]
MLALSIKERLENGTIIKFHPSSEIYLQKEMTKCTSSLEVSYTTTPPVFQEFIFTLAYLEKRPFIERFKFFFNHTNVHTRLTTTGIHGKFNILVSLNRNPGQPPIPKSQTSKNQVIKRLNELNRADNCLYLSNSKWGAKVSLAGFANRVRRTLIKTASIVFELHKRFKNIYIHIQSYDVMSWSTRCSEASPFGFNLIFKDVNENHSLIIRFYNQLQRQHAYLFFRIANDLSEFRYNDGDVNELNFEVTVMMPIQGG